MSRFTLATWILAETPPVGFTFDSRNWPLHITIVPPFFYDGGVNDLTAHLREVTDDLGRFEIEVGAVDYFGPNNDVEVNVINPNTSLARLHEQIVRKLGELGVSFHQAQFSNEGYRPHATVHGEVRVNEGQRIIIDAVALVLHEPNNIRHEREVVANMGLGK